MVPTGHEDDYYSTWFSNFILVVINVPPGHHGYCWSYHVPPGSMTLVSPGSVMIPSGRFPATVQGQNSTDFVTDGVSLNAMGGRKTAVATVLIVRYGTIDAFGSRIDDAYGFVFLSYLKRMAGPLVNLLGFCPETTHFFSRMSSTFTDHSMEPTGFEIDMHFLRGSRSLLELISQKGEECMDRGKVVVFIYLSFRGSFSYSAFDHDHDILVESRSWILQMVALDHYGDAFSVIYAHSRNKGFGLRGACEGLEASSPAINRRPLSLT
ncbi:hypothetical protein Tco_0774288 [Tanacetum coccineum]|uniref:Uncharacterized protein n=1 Tax=Tanacetum coccineum TaxID=301880 RepID=A0ABQ4ZP06_9ASTR